MIEVACIHRTRRVAITEDGQEMPVTHFFDANGDDCDCDEAVTCVAGPDKDGLWLSIDLTAFDEVVDQ